MPSVFLKCNDISRKMVFLLIYGNLHMHFAKICPDISLLTARGITSALAMNCSQHLEMQGVPEMYMPMSEDLEQWPLCSDLQMSNNNSMVQQCMCSPGYTDVNYGDCKQGIGKLRQLKNIDIGRISCNEPCPAPYQNIARLVENSACACWNRRGCVFEERSLLQMELSENIQPAVLMLPDSLVSDSFIVRCQQPLCAQRVSPQDIIVCSIQGIEYTYCNECPAECIKTHRSCSIHPSTRFCTVTCDTGFVRTVSSHNVTYDCVLKEVCPANFYHNDSSDFYGNIVQQKCVPCPIGKENVNSYGEVYANKSHSAHILPCMFTTTFMCTKCLFFFTGVFRVLSGKD